MLNNDLEIKENQPYPQKFMKLRNTFHLLFLVLIPLSLTLTLLNSCSDDIFSTDPANTLSFSTDTLSFDTVFTTLGSTTQKFIIYNKNNRALNISSIALGGKGSSQFRINVDGSISADNQFSNIEIRAKDSLYVFVEVTVNPTSSNSPLIIADSVVFNTNGKIQNVRLEAYGQDVIMLKNKYILSDSVLTAEKPFLIYGYLAVDSAKTLTISKGCKLYFHNNASLIVNGNLRAMGSFEEPIEIRGDRFDKMKFEFPIPYQYAAGQWGGIYLNWNRGNHLLQNVNISSGYVGVYFSNEDRSQLPNLEITNCRIQNFVYYGIVAQNGNMVVNNSEISNTGSFSLYLNGGKHMFYQSTIANYYNSNPGKPTTRDKNPAVMIMGLYRSAPMETGFYNCIIAGGFETELSIATRFIEQIKGEFANSYIRRKNAYAYDQFKDIQWSAVKDTIFKHPWYNDTTNVYFDFTPDSVSPARGIADPNIAKNFPKDLNGNNRMEDNAPDAGAYEWKPTK